MTSTLPDTGPEVDATPSHSSNQADHADTVAIATTSRGLPVLPWRQIVRWALVGTVVLLCFVGRDFVDYGGRNPVSLIQPGQKAQTYPVIHHDFPKVQAPPGVGLDGQMYYAIARDPFHLDKVAPYLDRPQYRLQRPLLPWMAWLLHPSGGGVGLVWALLAVGLAGIFAGAVATGALSVHFGGKPWLAAVLPVLPGAYWSLRVSVADAPALGLALVALALSTRKRPALAVLFGVLAVLTKEPLVIVFYGWALWRRDRWSVALAAVPTAVAGAWAVWLRIALPKGGGSVSEVSLPPFGGLVHATSHLWLHGQELVGMASSVAALLVAVFVLARRRGHPLWWIVAIHFAFAAVMSSDVIGMNFGGTRSNMALLLFAILAAATPSAVRSRRAHNEPSLVAEARAATVPA